MGNAAIELMIHDCESNGSKERAEKDLLKHRHNNIWPQQTALLVDTTRHLKQVRWVRQLDIIINMLMFTYHLGAM